MMTEQELVSKKSYNLQEKWGETLHLTCLVVDKINIINETLKRVFDIFMQFFNEFIKTMQEVFINISNLFSNICKSYPHNPQSYPQIYPHYSQKYPQYKNKCKMNFIGFPKPPLRYARSRC